MTDNTPANEPRLAEHETKLATNPKGTEDSTAPASDVGEGKTVASTVSDTAAQAANTASQAASAVKENVFSMFGGGPKKEKKAEEDDVDEPSGSSKAKKAADDEDVCESCQVYRVQPLTYFRRKRRKRKQTCTSSL